MPAPVLSFLLALLLLPQQVPADTAQQAVVLPVADTARMSPLPAPPADAIPGDFIPNTEARLQQEPIPEVPADTAAASPPPAAPNETTPSVETPDQEESLLGEWGRVQQAFDQQVQLLRRTFSLAHLLLAVLALALTYIVVRLVIWLLESVSRWRPAYAYQIQRVIPLAKFGLWFGAIWLVVGSLFAGSTLVLVVLVVLLVGAGMMAGFPFFRDLSGGLVLTLEQPFQIGSRVTVGRHQGEVQRIGLRAFELSTPDGATVVVPNAEVLHRSVTATPPNERATPVTVELVVPEAVDPDTARALAREAAYASPYVVALRPVTLTLVPPEEAGGRLRLRVEASVFDARYAEALASDVVRLTHSAFTRHGRDEATVDEA